MTSLRHFLPQPTQTLASTSIPESQNEFEGTLTVSNEKNVFSNIPEYGQRVGWIPRSLEDYGDGGAYPEIQVVQYPLDMGRKKQEKSNALPVKLDASGKIKYDALLKQGAAKDKVVYSKLQDLLPYEITADEEDTLKKPDEEEIKKITQDTKKALEMLTQSKISAAMPVRAAEKQGAAQYIRYTPAQQGSQFNSGAGQRIIRMVDAQKDPMEPPKYKINKKIPRGPPSPPAPVMHSPTRKVTVREQQDWKIPPCVSNWKNSKGYTIPLDKRLAADGRGLQQTHINENFSKFAEALYLADRKAREAVEARAQLERKVAAKEKEKKEEHLRMMAQRARDERAGLRTHAKDPDEDDDVRERDQLREERHRDRQRERNISRAAPDKKHRLERQRERDISEQIALGMPSSSSKSSEVQFDQRLFNQSKGMDSGFGHEDDYTVYDKPWRNQQGVSQGLYRPGRERENAEDLDKMIKTSRFVPDKDFAGTDRSGAAKRDGPVQFEKVQEEEDPFGLDKFFNEAKKASKRSHDDDSKSSKKRRD